MILLSRFPRATKDPSEYLQISSFFFKGDGAASPASLLSSCGLGHQELRNIYRLIQITALIAINANSMTSIIEFNPKARFFGRIGGWQFEQANLESPNPRNRGMA